MRAKKHRAVRLAHTTCSINGGPSSLSPKLLGAPSSLRVGLLWPRRESRRQEKLGRVAGVGHVQRPERRLLGSAPRCVSPAWLRRWARQAVPRAVRRGGRFPASRLGEGGPEQMGGGRPASLLQQPPRGEEAGPVAAGAKAGSREPALRTALLVPRVGTEAGASWNENELRGLLSCLVYLSLLAHSKPRMGNQVTPNSQSCWLILWGPRVLAKRSGDRGLVQP